MPLKKIFWFLALLIILFFTLNIIGYNTLEIVIILLFVEIVVLKIWNEYSKDIIKTELLRFLDIFENSLKNFKNKSFQMITDIQYIDIERHKDELRKEFKGNLDKIAKKSISIENELNKLKKDVMFLLSELNKKIKRLEESY